MAIDSRSRVRLISQLLDEFEGKSGGSPWKENRINIVFREFDLEAIQPGYDPEFLGAALANILGSASDATLVDVYACVFDVETSDVIGVAASADDNGIWKQDLIRVFISHAAIHKSAAASVSTRLAAFGIDGFVAHDAVTVTRPWQREIERALNSAQAFVGLVDNEFNESAWTNQEIGWAYGRRLPVFFVRMGADPEGFPGATQWPIAADEAQAASRIVQWLNGVGVLSEKIGNGLIRALGEAASYFDAEIAAKGIDQLGPLTEAQLSKLDEAFKSNDQVHGSILARRALGPVYARHKREMPSR